MGRVIVITGTDTEVGKTFVGAALARGLVDAGTTVVAVKPVESGCEGRAEEQEDGVVLAAASGQASPARALQRLKAPLAPPVAAAMEGVRLEPRRWIARTVELALAFDVVLVEGAGGLLSPLAAGCDALELAKALDAEVILVVGNWLGALNHTLLSLRALQAEGVGVAGIVFSSPRAPDLASASNPEALARVLGEAAPPIVVVPHLSATSEAVPALEALLECLGRVR